MTLRFTKMHGLGNDFMVIEARKGDPLPDTSTWRKLADRHTGVGFDQALVILPPHQPDSVASYKIFNADGGEVEQCGNGARCVAEWLRLSARLSDQAVQMGFSLESLGGRIEARFGEPGMVSVNMGTPHFLTKGNTTLSVANRDVSFTEVSMGNPHVVLRVDEVDVAPVATLGALLESHPRFPNRTNVAFLQVIDRAHARLRVFERGVGETLACGTGACAAMAAGRRSGWFGDDVNVRLPGGSLQISWRGENSVLWMTGPAAVAYRGEVDFL